MVTRGVGGAWLDALEFAPVTSQMVTRDASEPRFLFRNARKSRNATKASRSLRPLSHRIPSCRGGAHRPFQLALRASFWWNVDPSDRGYRLRAFDPGDGRRHPPRPGLAGN